MPQQLFHLFNMVA